MVGLAAPLLASRSRGLVPNSAFLEIFWPFWGFRAFWGARDLGMAGSVLQV